MSKLARVIHLAILLQLLTVSTMVASPQQHVRIGALLPSGTKWPFSNAHGMLEAAQIAIHRVQTEMGFQPQLTILHRDSNCSEVYGMNQAINFVIEDKVNVLFGPICDFAAAPVARQVTFWNKPMVTVGAIAWDFKSRKADVYPLLTRAGTTNLFSLTNYIFEMMATYRWNHFKFVYSRDYDGGSVTPKLCHLTTEAHILYRKKEDTNIDIDYWTLETGDTKEIEKVLLDEVDNKFSGK